MSRTVTDRLILAVPFLEDGGWVVHSWRDKEGSWKQLPETEGTRKDFLVLPAELTGLLLETPAAMAIVEDASDFRLGCECEYVVSFPAVEDLGLVVWRKDTPCISGCQECEHVCDHEVVVTETPPKGQGGVN